jgi:hypothetical protein
MSDIYETIAELDRIYNEVIQLRERDNGVLQDAKRQLYDLGRDNARLRQALEKIANGEMLDIITATDIAVRALEGGEE